MVTYFRHVFFLYVAVIVFTNAGNFVVIGSTEVTHRAFLSIVTFAIALMVTIFYRTYDRRILIAGLFLYLSVIIGYFMLAIRPYESGVIRDVVDWDAYVSGTVSLDYSLSLEIDWDDVFKVVQFPIVLSAAFKAFEGRKQKRIFLEKLLIILDFVLIYSLIEAIAIKTVSFPIGSYVVDTIFGNSDATQLYTDRLRGFFKEASHYAGGMYIWGMLLIFQLHAYHRSKTKPSKIAWARIRLITILVLLFLSTSFIGLFYIALLVLAAIAFNTKLNNWVLALVFVVLGSIGLFIITNESLMSLMGLSDMYERVNTLFETFELLRSGKDGPSGTSEGARLTSIYYMLEILKSRPLFGVGLAITDAHSMLFGSLGNIGIVGTSIVYYMYIRFGKIESHKISFAILILPYLCFAGQFGTSFDFLNVMLFFFAGYAFEKPKKAVTVKNARRIRQNISPNNKAPGAC